MQNWDLWDQMSELARPTFSLFQSNLTPFFSPEAYLMKAFLGRFAYSSMKLTSDCINSSSMALLLKSAPSGYDMSPFIRRYAKYLSEKSTAYRFIFLNRALVLFLHLSLIHI